MAHKKGQSSSRNGRDSKPKFLGIKAFGGETVSAGSIIVRQRGTRSVRATTSAAAATSPSLPSATAPSSSARSSARSASFRLPPTERKSEAILFDNEKPREVTVISGVFGVCSPESCKFRIRRYINISIEMRKS